jgi:hypothetical protein
MGDGGIVGFHGGRGKEVDIIEEKRWKTNLLRLES